MVRHLWFIPEDGENSNTNLPENGIRVHMNYDERNEQNAFMAIEISVYSRKY